MEMKDRIKQIRIENKMSQEQFGKEVDLTKGTVSKFENGKAFPGRETIEKIAKRFNVSVDYLLGRTEQKNRDIIKDEEDFSEKDKKDIGKRMEEIRKDLKDTDGLMFSGEPLSEEALDSLMDAMEYIVKHTQKVNKKYIPKKYRKESE
jgi:transcriptional regulator with XRE-family HTH domain